MANIIAIINQKGGVGKSTTAQALGGALAIQGEKVLFVDLDAQGNLTYSMSAAAPGRGTSMDLLSGQSARDIIQKTNQGDVIPGAPGLATADIILTSTGKEYRLQEALASVKDDYQTIIIDTPPALGILTVNALTAANQVIIPAQTDIYSLQGIGQLYGTLEAVKKYTNPSLRVTGILLTRYSPRTVLSRDMTELLEDTAKQLQTKVFETKIRECIALREAQAARQSIFDWAPKSNAAQDYAALAREVG